MQFTIYNLQIPEVDWVIYSKAGPLVLSQPLLSQEDQGMFGRGGDIWVLQQQSPLREPLI